MRIKNVSIRSVQFIIFLLFLLHSTCLSATGQVPAFSEIARMMKKASYEEIAALLGNKAEKQSGPQQILYYKEGGKSWQFRFYEDKLLFFKYTHAEDELTTVYTPELNTLQQTVHNASTIEEVLEKAGAPNEVKITPGNTRIVYLSDHQLIEYAFDAGAKLECIYMDEQDQRSADDRLSYPQVKVIAKIKTPEALIEAFGPPSQVIFCKDNASYRYISKVQKPNTTCSLTVSFPVRNSIREGRPVAADDHETSTASQKMQYTY